MDHKKAHEDLKKSPRKNGIISLVISVALAGIFILWPFIQAQQQAPEIGIYMSGVAGAVGTFVIGIILLVFGEKAVDLIAIDPQNIRGGQVVFLLITAAVGIALFFTVMAFLSGLGYT